MEVVVFYAIYIGAALLFTVAAVFAVGGALHAGTRKREGFLVLFVAPIVLVMAASTIASGRNLMLPGALELMPAVGESGGGWVKWLQRAVTLFLLATSVERLARFAFQPRQPGRPLALMLSFGLCWLATVALPAAFGTRPSISHEYFYALLIGLAALTTDERGAWHAIRVARDALLLFVLAGLLMLVLKRDLVLSPYAGGLVPAFAWRYSGLASGPNSMGPLCVLALLTLRTLPLGRPWLQRAAVGMVLLSLLLTQSKSSWLAGLACWGVFLLIAGKGRLARWAADARNRQPLQFALIVAAVGIATLLLAIGAGLGQEKVERFLATRAGSDLLTLTGRSEIWAVALDTFQRSPWFGYGPSIWDAYFRWTIGIPAAFHAHNQYINVLAASGLVGALGFAGYLVALLRRLLSRFSAYGGFAAALATLLLMRSVSEVPFNFHSFGGETMMQMLLLMVLAGAPEQQAKPKLHEASRV